MNRPADDLHVAYERVNAGADLEFHAQRLSEPGSLHWVLYLTTDHMCCELTRVVPAALGHSFDSRGVLGLLFPASVTCVHLGVKVPGGEAPQHWYFWMGENFGPM